MGKRPEVTAAGGAQRRPGREPRRHHLPLSHSRTPSRRSTKAGARTPATPWKCAGWEARKRRAQRRPGREPRRHEKKRDLWDAVRSSLNEGRGANPGDTHTPRRRRRRTRALDEGRGANPGDTGEVVATAAGRPVRSTKAGARTPATLIEQADRGAVADERSTKAGARTPATRQRPGRGPERRGRSTKAGARTPATPAIRRRFGDQSAHAQRRPGREPRRHCRSRTWACGSAGSLNEGRGANPGDTRPLPLHAQPADRRSTKAGARTPATPPRMWPARASPRSAQRRPGREPRRHSASSWYASLFLYAQRRPGREPRRHPVAAVQLRGDRGRSTKAGARTPATRQPRSAATCWTDRAQRRPGHEPRRHLLVGQGVVAPGDRSTKAGARTPATLRRRPAARTPSDALNEGRGANPGDTRPGQRQRAGRQRRSTKAGARTPATPRRRR